MVWEKTNRTVKYSNIISFLHSATFYIVLQPEFKIFVFFIEFQTEFKLFPFIIEIQTDFKNFVLQ